MEGQHNGPPTHHHSERDDEKARKHNYKLIVDPFLRKGQQKLYRIDGTIQGEPSSRVIVSDPRSRVAKIFTKTKQADLIVPQFKVDEFYVGTPPPKELTFLNLNDNINATFLRSMVEPLGQVDDCSICYNPNTNKHLGIAKVVFETTRAAKACVEKYDQTSKMGMIMTVFIDSLGKERQGYIDEKVYGIVRRPSLFEEAPLPTQPAIIPMHDTTVPPTIPIDSDDTHISSNAHTAQNEPIFLSVSTSDYSKPLEIPISEDLTDDRVKPPRDSRDGTRIESQHRKEENEQRWGSEDEYNRHPRDRDRRGNRGRDGRERWGDTRADTRDDRNGRERWGDRDSRERWGDRDRYDRGTGRERSDYDSHRSRDDHKTDWYDRDRDPDRDRRDRWSNRRDDRRGYTRYDRQPGHHNSRDYRDYEARDGRHDQRRSDVDRRAAPLQIRDRYDREGRRGTPPVREHRSPPRRDETRLEETRGDSQSSREEIVNGKPRQEAHTPEAQTPEADAPSPTEETELPTEATSGQTELVQEEVPTADPSSLDLDSRIQMMFSSTIPGLSAPEEAATAVSMDTTPDVTIPEPSSVSLAVPPTTTPLGPMVTPLGPPATPLGPSATPLGMPIDTSVPPPLTGPPPYPPPGIGYVPPVPERDAMYGGFYGVPPPEWNYAQYGEYGAFPSEFIAEEEPQIEFTEAFDDSLETLIEELKNVLNMDLCKRMVRQCAFRYYDTWWNKEEIKTKNMLREIQQEVEPSEVREPVKAAPALLETKSLFSGGSFLGLGVGLPRMPSFRKKISPEEEAARKAAEEEKKRRHERREAELERRRADRENSKPQPRKPRALIRGSVSSAASSSAESSSESGDSDGESRAASSSGSSSDGPSSAEESEEESSSEDSSSDSSEESEKEEETPIKVDKKTTKKKSTVQPQKIAPSREILSSSEDEAETETKARSDVEAESESGSQVQSGTEARSESETGELSSSSESDAEFQEPKPVLVKKKPLPKPKPPPKKPAKKTAKQTKKKVDEPMEVDVNLSVASRLSDDEDIDTVDVQEEESQIDNLMLYINVEHSYSRPVREDPNQSQENIPEIKPVEKPTKPAKITKGNRELDRLLNSIPERPTLHAAERLKISESESKPAVISDDMIPDSVKQYDAMPEAVKPSRFVARDAAAERSILYSLFTRGIDEEDKEFVKLAYQKMFSQEDDQYAWTNDTRWTDHPITFQPEDDSPPPAKKRKKGQPEPEPPSKPAHKTGCARSQGYYKISYYEKSKYMVNARQFQKRGQILEEKKAQEAKKVQAQNMLREARSNQRRLATAFGDLDTGELLKFNQLKFRKKALKFTRSPIHDWGLYALEPIPADTMVIEYVGVILRHSVADEREKQYERVGIGSSYLFRIDADTVIDATKCGNLARFVNHSCDPNCYAQVITVDSRKKIVIYSRRKIDMNEEITYDYKFPYEDEKIPCLCGMAACRGFLN